MSKASEDRPLRMYKVLSRLYLVADGDQQTSVPRHEVEGHVGLQPDEALDAVHYMDELTLGEFRGSQKLRITHKGILRFEEYLRQELLEKGPEECEESEEVGEQFRLWRQLVWERHMILLRVHNLVVGRVKNWVGRERIPWPEVGLDQSAIDRGVFFLSDEGSLDMPATLGLVGLSYDGAEYVEDYLDKAGSENPSQDELLAIKAELWKAEMPAPRIDSERRGEVFPTPPGARWQDIRIRFKDNERVSVQVKGKSGVYNFTQMGMVDNRTSGPTRQWDLLRSFANGHGFLDWMSSDASPKNQKRRERLANDLRQFFGIEDDPFVITDKDRKFDLMSGWKTRFLIEPPG